MTSAVACVCLFLFPAATVELSLAQALQRASERAPSVQVAEKQTREAAARRVGAGVFLPWNPRLYGEARPALSGPFAFGFAANLEVPFEVSGASWARIAEAEQTEHRAVRDAERVRYEARHQVWVAYVDAQLAAERRRAVEASLQTAEQALAAAKERSKAGAAGEIDTLTAELQRADLALRLLDTEAGQTEMLLALAHLVDIEPGTPLALTTPLDVLPPYQESPPLLERHPVLDSLRASLQVIERTDLRLGREALPKISLFTGVDAAPLSPMFGQVGLSIELAFAQRLQGPRAANRALLDTELSRLALETRHLQREAESLRAIYEKRRSALALIDQSAMPNAEKQYAHVEAGYRLGRFDVFRLTVAARELHALRLLRVDVLGAAWRDRIALSRALGEKP